MTEEDKKELVVVEKQTALEAFNDDVKLEALFKSIKDSVTALLPDGGDMSKKKDRDIIRSLAAKIPKVKTRIDDFRKESTEDMRNQITAINERGSSIRDRLDELKDEIRKPLTDWEKAEEDRINGHTTKIQTIRGLADIPFGASSDDIQARIELIPADDLDSYDEYRDEAQTTIEDVFTKLTEAKTVALNTERELAARKEEQEELDRLRKESEERERIEAIKLQMSNLRMLGAGLNSDGEEIELQTALDSLLAARIGSSFGDKEEEANGIRDRGISQIRDRLAKAKAAKDEQDAKDAELRRLSDAEADAERQREEAALLEEQNAAAELERLRLEEEQRIENERLETERLAAVAEERRLAKERRADAVAAAESAISDILAGKKRYEAPSALLDAIISGAIPYVSSTIEPGDEEEASE